MISHIQNNPYFILGEFLRSNQGQLNDSLSKLTSGLRVQSPSDDPGAYFVAQSLTRRAETTRNLASELDDNINALKTARDSLTEIRSLLEQQSELADDAANTDDDTLRAIYADEFDEIKGQIDTLVSSFNFNGDNLLNAAQTFTVQVDENTSDTISYDLFDTTFGNATGLNLGNDGGDDYSTATGVWEGSGGGDAAERASAQNFHDAIEGTRPDDSSASGLAQLDRNLARISNTITLLEGRQNSLTNKASNYEAASSALVGVDEAAETTKYTAAEMMQQAGAYFLAQANTHNSFVTGLLFGFNPK